MLINNAGSSQRAIIVDTQLEVDRAILELNTIGTVSLTKCVLPHMLERGSGSLAVISSIAGIIRKLRILNLNNVSLLIIFPYLKLLQALLLTL